MNNGFMNLYTVVEGVTTAALKYFFDPKEPVITLKPMLDKPIDAELYYQLSNELSDKGYVVHDSQGKVELVTTKGRRNFCKFTELGEASDYRHHTAFYKLPDVNHDELHKANMSLMWNWMQSVKGTGGYSAQNALYALKTVFALAESNRGRLVYLATQQTLNMLRFDAYFVSGKRGAQTLTKVEFLSDDTNWDLPDTVNVPFEVHTEYDGFGRLTGVYKHRTGNRAHSLYEIDITYLSKRNELPADVFVEAESGIAAIPVVLIKHLDISKVTSIQEKILIESGMRSRVLDVVTTKGQALTINLKF